MNNDVDPYIDDERLHSNYIQGPIRRNSTEYAKVYKQQNGLCAVCRQRKALQIDREPTTQKIKGLICNKCYKSIEYFRGNMVLLRRTLLYIMNEGVNCDEA